MLDNLSKQLLFSRRDVTRDGRLIKQILPSVSLPLFFAIHATKNEKSVGVSPGKNRTRFVPSKKRLCIRFSFASPFLPRSPFEEISPLSCQKLIPNRISFHSRRGNSLRKSFAASFVRFWTPAAHPASSSPSSLSLRNHNRVEIKKFAPSSKKLPRFSVCSNFFIKRTVPLLL